MAVNLHFSSNTSDNLSEESQNNGEPDTINSDSSFPDLSNSIHLLPCYIDYNGESSVEKFFHKYISTSKNSNSQTEYTGTFRGYPLKGSVVSPPDGFTFAQMRDVKVDSQESRTLKESKRFDSFIFWNVSEIPSPRDPLLKALKWVEIAKIIHED